MAPARRYPARHGRAVAQPGSAPASGAGGRRFESSQPDQFTQIGAEFARVRFGAQPSPCTLFGRYPARAAMTPRSSANPRSLPISG